MVALARSDVGGHASVLKCLCQGRREAPGVSEAQLLLQEGEAQLIPKVLPAQVVEGQLSVDDRGATNPGFNSTDGRIEVAHGHDNVPLFGQFFQRRVSNKLLDCGGLNSFQAGGAGRAAAGGLQSGSFEAKLA